MSLMFMLDNRMSELTATLEPHQNILDINNPGGLSGVNAIPSPVASNICNYIDSDRQTPPSQEQIDFLAELAE